MSQHRANLKCLTASLPRAAHSAHTDTSVVGTMYKLLCECRRNVRTKPLNQRCHSPAIVCKGHELKQTSHAHSLPVADWFQTIFSFCFHAPHGLENSLRLAWVVFAVAESDELWAVSQWVAMSRTYFRWSHSHRLTIWLHGFVTPKAKWLLPTPRAQSMEEWIFRKLLQIAPSIACL